MINKFSVFAVFSLMLAGSGTFAQTASVQSDLKYDQFSYEHIYAGGDSNYAGLWSYIYDPNDPVYGGTEFPFNYMMACAVISFDVSLPAHIVGTSYNITSARIELTHQNNATWDPAQTELKIFAAGFGPTYSESTWTENSAYIGSTSFPTATYSQRDPYPKELIGGAHAEDNQSAESWAIASHPDYLTASQINSRFKITFNFDLSKPEIVNELKADLSSGKSSWIVGSTFPLGGPGGSATYPVVLLRGSNAPDPSILPKLYIEVEPTSGVSDWALF